jgi:hypothetical protein
MSNAAIIDYASPVSRAKLRLPARSEIHWANEPGRLVVTQVLSGREGAIGALLLAAFTFVLMSFSIMNMIGKWHRYIGEIGIMGMFMAAEVIVGALVIHNTWRKTILTVTPDELIVELAAPFSGRERHAFRGEQVAGVVVVDREPLPGEAVVPELEIQFWSIPPIHLFAGHPHPMLMRIAAGVGQMQHLAPPPLPGAAADVRPATVTALAAVKRGAPVSGVPATASEAVVAPGPTPAAPAPAPPASPPAPPQTAQSDPGFTVNL